MVQLVYLFMRSKFIWLIGKNCFWVLEVTLFIETLFIEPDSQPIDLGPLMWAHRYHLIFSIEYEWQTIVKSELIEVLIDKSEFHLIFLNVASRGIIHREKFDQCLPVLFKITPLRMWDEFFKIFVRKHFAFLEQLVLS